MNKLKFVWFRLLDLFANNNVLMLTHSRRGRFRVLYSDGQLSTPMHYKTAKDYASMFDGKVILK